MPYNFVDFTTLRPAEFVCDCGNEHYLSGPIESAKKDTDTDCGRQRVCCTVHGSAYGVVTNVHWLHRQTDRPEPSCGDTVSVVLHFDRATFP